jgi:4-hydroxyacetophenone monooxygenase
MTFEVSQTALPDDRVRGSFSRDEISRALEDADPVTLLLVLTQFTRDPALLDRAQPFINGPMNYQAAIPDELQSEIRDRLSDVLAHHFEAGGDMPPVPEGPLLQKMLSTAAGEPVAEDYVAMMREDLDAERADPGRLRWRKPIDPTVLGGFHTLIIGAGMSGLCAAIRLREAGLPFTIIEKNQGIGGSWYENIYPGCGVDTPNHFYSYSFELNHDWSHFFARRDELWSYFENVADKFDIRKHIRFGEEVLACRFDDGRQIWSVEVRKADGTIETLEANAVISAVGLLNRPKIPEFKGLSDFQGPVMHTAQWDPNFDWTGKKVVLIGTGASAQQAAPTMADATEHLTIVQRSAHWVVPNPNYFAEVGDGLKWVLKHVPFYVRWYRFQLFWAFADGLHAALQVDPNWEDPDRSVNMINARHRRFMEEYANSKLGEDSPLLAKVIPNYPPYGKRILIDNKWFEMLNRDNVSLETSGVAQIHPHAVELEDGTMIEADAIVAATGFRTTEVLFPMTITGRGGVDIHAMWGKDDATAYLGTMVPHFPNFYTLVGPNTGLAHGGNVIFVTECQMRLVLNCLREQIERGDRTIEVRQDVHDAYNDEVEELHSRMVWTHKGMTSWYRNDRGRVFALLPYRLVDYWRMTTDFDPQDFIFG